MRSLIRYMERSPYIEALFEVALIVALALGPLALASLISIANANMELTLSTFTDGVYALIQYGELSFLTLTACGAILWILLVKSVTWSWIPKVLIGFFVFFAVLVSAGLIGRDPTLDTAPPSWVVLLTAIIYAAAILFLYLSTAWEDQVRGGFIGETPRAGEILKEAGRAEE